MPAFSDPARRSGAAKSKEEAEGQQACGATHNNAGGPTDEAHATEHAGLIPGRRVRRKWRFRWRRAIGIGRISAGQSVILPLPLRERVGGRGRTIARQCDRINTGSDFVVAFPSPQPPPARGGGVICLQPHHCHVEIGCDWFARPAKPRRNHLDFPAARPSVCRATKPNVQAV
jgi:hypothetical protein